MIPILGLACLCKLVGAAAGARWAGCSPPDQWAIAWTLNARGAMEIIPGTLAFDERVIDQRTFVALVVMALATSDCSGLIIRR